MPRFRALSCCIVFPSFQLGPPLRGDPVANKLESPPTAATVELRKIQSPSTTTAKTHIRYTYRRFALLIDPNNPHTQASLQIILEHRPSWRPALPSSSSRRTPRQPRRNRCQLPPPVATPNTALLCLSLSLIICEIVPVQIPARQNNPISTLPAYNFPDPGSTSLSRRMVGVHE